MPAEPRPFEVHWTRSPVRIVGEIVDWVGHSPEKLQAMRDGLDELRRRGEDLIDD